MDAEITLRPATDADDELLFQIYASTRLDEVTQFGWGDKETEAFIRMQFASRRNAYKFQFPAAEYSMIELDGRSVGSLVVERRYDAISLTDIAVLPDFAGRGVGSAVIDLLKDKATDAGLPIVLSVDKTNPAAMQFYAARGFEVTGESQINYSMVWQPNK